MKQTQISTPRRPVSSVLEGQSFPVEVHQLEQRVSLPPCACALGPPARCPSLPFLWGEGSPTKVEYWKKIGYPYSILSTAGPGTLFGQDQPSGKQGAQGPVRPNPLRKLALPCSGTLYWAKPKRWFAGLPGGSHLPSTRKDSTPNPNHPNSPYPKFVVWFGVVFRIDLCQFGRPSWLHKSSQAKPPPPRLVFFGAHPPRLVFRGSPASDSERTPLPSRCSQGAA